MPTRIRRLKQEAIEACLTGATLKKLKTIYSQDKEKKPVVASRLIPEARGRQSTLVKLGTTKKIHVARLIIDSVLTHEKVMHLKSHYSDLNWSDYKSINHAFKHLLKTLEKIDA